MNIEITEERFFSAMFGRRNWDIIRDVLPKASQGEIHRLAGKKETIFRELVAGNVTPLPGAVELLRQTHAQAIKQAIVSSTPRENIELIVRTLEVEELLD